MKKFCGIIAVVLLVTTILFVLTGTANAESNLVNGIPTTDTEMKCSKNEYEFPNLPNNEDAINDYCEEIKRRHQKEVHDGSFLNDDEVKFLESMGYNVLIPGKIVHKYDEKYGGLDSYEFPVIYQGPNGIELWYTNSEGELVAEAVSGKLSNGYSWQTYGNIHYRERDEVEMVIASNKYYSVLYNPEYSEVSIWEYGIMTRQHILPGDSIYAGYSINEGFIFRCGTKVYAVRDYGYYGCFAEKYKVCLIAHNVEFVIATDYEGDGTEGLSQPLFLMEDGSIRFYCNWYNDNDVPADDDSNLIDVRFERGFNL